MNMGPDSAAIQDGNDGNVTPNNIDTGINSDGGDSWVNILPDEIRSAPSITKFKDPGELAKSYLNLEKLIGKEKIPVPQGDDDVEAWNVFKKALGVPEDPDGYELPDVDSPEGFELDHDLITEFKSKALELGLTPKQAAELYKWSIENETTKYQQIMQKQQETVAKAEETLRKEWGAAFDEKIAIAEKVLDQFADEEVESLLESGLKNDPRFIKFLAKVGENFTEDVIQGKPKSFTYTPEEAQKEINAILGNMDHPYHKKDHIEHQAAVEKMRNLFLMAYPSK